MSSEKDALRLLGAFQLHLHGQEVVLGQPRLEELVALLALHAGEPVPRSRIAYSLWPESNESQARANVRGVLHKLKQAWPAMEDAIAVDRTHFVWRSDEGIPVDVCRFAAALRTREGSCIFR